MLYGQEPLAVSGRKMPLAEWLFDNWQRLLSLCRMGGVPEGNEIAVSLTPVAMVVIPRPDQHPSSDFFQTLTRRMRQVSTRNCLHWPSGALYTNPGPEICEAGWRFRLATTACPCRNMMMSGVLCFEPYSIFYPDGL